MGGCDNKLIFQAIQFFLMLIGSTEFYGDPCILQSNGTLACKHSQHTLLFMREEMRTRIGKNKDTQVLLGPIQGNPGKGKVGRLRYARRKSG